MTRYSFAASFGSPVLGMTLANDFAKSIAKAASNSTSEESGVGAQPSAEDFDQAIHNFVDVVSRTLGDAAVEMFASESPLRTQILIDKIQQAALPYANRFEQIPPATLVAPTVNQIRAQLRTQLELPDSVANALTATFGAL